MRRQSPEDARVRTALSNPAMRSLTNVALEGRLGISRQKIGEVRAAMEAEGRIESTAERYGKDGRRIRTGQAKARPRTARVRASAREKRSHLRGRTEGLAEGLAWGQGVDLDELHQRAAECLALDRAYKRELAAMVKDARQRARSFGINLVSLKARSARGFVDINAVRGLDALAMSLGMSYPEHFHAADDFRQQALDLLIAPAPKPITVEESYGKAIDSLTRRGWSGGHTAAA